MDDAPSEHADGTSNAEVPPQHAVKEELAAQGGISAAPRG